MGEDHLRPGELVGEPEGVLAECGDSATRVDQHRDPALVGDREDTPHRCLVEREGVGARVELDAASTGVEAPFSLAHGIVMRVEPAERHEAAGGRRGLRQHAVVGRAVTLGLVHREDDGAGADRVERGQQLLGGAAKAVRVARARVRVGVEEREPRHVIGDRPQPLREQLGGAHRVQAYGRQAAIDPPPHRSPRGRVECR